MERLVGLSDFPILGLVGAGIVVWLLYQAFKGNGKGGDGNNSSGTGGSTGIGGSSGGTTGGTTGGTV